MQLGSAINQQVRLNAPLNIRATATSRWAPVASEVQSEGSAVSRRDRALTCDRASRSVVTDGRPSHGAKGWLATFDGARAAVVAWLRAELEDAPPLPPNRGLCHEGVPSMSMLAVLKRLALGIGGTALIAPAVVRA
jgi:hypothetical protein